MNTNPVIIEKVYNKSLEHVWDALVNNEHLKEWYFKLDEFKAEPGFTFSFYGGEEGGEQYKHICEVTEVIDDKILIYSWRYDGKPGISYVKWELTPEGNGTKLTLTHEGLESIEPAGAAFSRNNFVTGWTYFLDEALNNYLNTCA